MSKILRKNKNFKERDREFFMWNNACWVCGKNTWDVLHHILGGEFEEADSILNAAPLCNYPCHIGGGHAFTEEDRKQFLNKTFFYLMVKGGYKLNEKDKSFLKKFRDYYDSDIFFNNNNFIDFDGL